MKRTLILAAGTATVVGVTGLAGMGIAAAATGGSQQESLADKIAQRFKLDKTEVQKVLDEDRVAHKAEHEQRLNERIDQAVTDGTVSKELADQLKAKLKEVSSLHDQLQDKSEEERRAAMKAKMTELKQWADDNNVPLKLLRMRMGGPGAGREGPGPGPEKFEDNLN